MISIKKSWRPALATTVVGLSILVTGCSEKEEEMAAKVDTAPSTELAADQVFTYRVLDEHSSLDPGIIEDVTGAEIARDLFEGLLTQNPDGTLAPGVAESWSANDAKNVYTFKLRADAKWSNGDPVTAHDFEFAWKRAVEPELASPYAWYMEIMSIKNGAAVIAGDMPSSELGVKAIDDLTFQVELEASLPYFASMVVHTTTMPVPKKVVEAHGSDWTKTENFVSNGAYVLDEHVVNERLVRVRNNMYWDNANTTLDKVVSLVINDENQALNRYMAGELDKTEVPAGQYKRLKAELPSETYAFPRLCSYYYNFNMEKAPFDDVRVRTALTYAFDRDIITDSVLGAGQYPAYTFTPAATANFEVPNVAFAKMTQAERLAEAKKLMEEAGFGPENPLKATILYNTSEAHKKVAIAISQMWKESLGVEITLENQEWKTFLDTRGNGDYEISRAGWCGDYNEASTFLDLVNSKSGYNDSNYNNPAVDQLLADAKTMANPNSNYTKIEEIIAKDFPIMPIYHYTGNIMIKDYMKGWPIANVEQNWYSKNFKIMAH